METVSSSPVLVQDEGKQVTASGAASSSTSCAWRHLQGQLQQRCSSSGTTVGDHGGGGLGCRIKFKFAADQHIIFSTPAGGGCGSSAAPTAANSAHQPSAYGDVVCPPDPVVPLRLHDFQQLRSVIEAAGSRAGEEPVAPESEDVEAVDVGIQHHPTRGGDASSMTAHPAVIADFCSTAEQTHGSGRRRKSSSSSLHQPPDEEEEDGVEVDVRPPLHPLVAAAGNAVADAGIPIRDGQLEDNIFDEEATSHPRKRVTVTFSCSPPSSRRNSHRHADEDGKRKFQAQDEQQQVGKKEELDLDEAVSISCERTFVLDELKGRGASLARGYSADVYTCFDRSQNRFAMKIVTAKSKRQLAIFREEVRLLEKCREEQCGHVVKMYRWMENLPKLQLLLLLEYADCDLAAYIERFQNPLHSGDSSDTEVGAFRTRSPPPPRGEVRRSGMPFYPTLFDCFRQMLRAVGEIHRHKVVHCDIKPANFLLFNGKTVKLSDLGLARRIGSEDTHVSRDVQCGTLRYMAPECVFQPANLLFYCGNGSSSGSGSSGSSSSEGEGKAETGPGGVAGGGEEDAGWAPGTGGSSKNNKNKADRDLELEVEPEAKRMKILNSTVEPEARLHQAEADDAQLHNQRHLKNRQHADRRPPPPANKLRRTPPAAFHVRPSADVWSLGIVLYSLLYLRAPFEELEMLAGGARGLMFAISDPRVEIRYPSLRWLARKHARDLRLEEDASRSETETQSAARSRRSKPPLLAQDMFRHMVAVAQKCLQRVPRDRWTCEALLEAWTRIERDFHCQSQQRPAEVVADEAGPLRLDAYLSSSSASGASALKGSGDSCPSGAHQHAEQEHDEECQPLLAKVAQQAPIFPPPPLKPDPEPSGTQFIRFREQQDHHVAVQVEQEQEDCGCPTAEKPFGFGVSLDLFDEQAAIDEVRSVLSAHNGAGILGEDNQTETGLTPQQQHGRPGLGLEEHQDQHARNRHDLDFHFQDENAEAAVDISPSASLSASFWAPFIFGPTSSSTAAGNFTYILTFLLMGVALLTLIVGTSVVLHSDVVARAPELGKNTSSPPTLAPAPTPSQPWDSGEVNEQEDDIAAPSSGHGPPGRGVDADSTKGPAQSKTKPEPDTKAKRKPKEPKDKEPKDKEPKDKEPKDKEPKDKEPKEPKRKPRKAPPKPPPPKPRQVHPTPRNPPPSVRKKSKMRTRLSKLPSKPKQKAHQMTAKVTTSKRKPSSKQKPKAKASSTPKARAKIFLSKPRAKGKTPSKEKPPPVPPSSKADPSTPPTKCQAQPYGPGTSTPAATLPSNMGDEKDAEVLLPDSPSQAGAAASGAPFGFDACADTVTEVEVTEAAPVAAVAVVEEEEPPEEAEAALDVVEFVAPRRRQNKSSGGRPDSKATPTTAPPEDFDGSQQDYPDSTSSHQVPAPRFVPLLTYASATAAEGSSLVRGAGGDDGAGSDESSSAEPEDGDPSESPPRPPLGRTYVPARPRLPAAGRPNQDADAADRVRANPRSGTLHQEQDHQEPPDLVRVRLAEVRSILIALHDAIPAAEYDDTEFGRLFPKGRSDIEARRRFFEAELRMAFLPLLEGSKDLDVESQSFKVIDENVDEHDEVEPSQAEAEPRAEVTAGVGGEKREARAQQDGDRFITLDFTSRKGEEADAPDDSVEPPQAGRESSAAGGSSSLGDTEAGERREAREQQGSDRLTPHDVEQEVGDEARKCKQDDEETAEKEKRQREPREQQDDSDRIRIKEVGDEVRKCKQEAEAMYFLERYLGFVTLSNFGQMRMWSLWKRLDYIILLLLHLKLDGESGAGSGRWELEVKATRERLLVVVPRAVLAGRTRWLPEAFADARTAAEEELQRLNAFQRGTTASAQQLVLRTHRTLVDAQRKVGIVEDVDGGDGAARGSAAALGMVAVGVGAKFREKLNRVREDAVRSRFAMLRRRRSTASASSSSQQEDLDRAEQHEDGVNAQESSSSSWDLDEDFIATSADSHDVGSRAISSDEKVEVVQRPALRLRTSGSASPSVVIAIQQRLNEERRERSFDITTEQRVVLMMIEDMLTFLTAWEDQLFINVPSSDIGIADSGGDQQLEAKKSAHDLRGLWRLADEFKKVRGPLMANLKWRKKVGPHRELEPQPPPVSAGEAHVARKLLRGSR